MTVDDLRKLRSELPTRYSVGISKKLTKKKISSVKVRRVFAGEITNPEIVLPVIKEAMKMVPKTRQVKSKLKNLLS